MKYLAIFVILAVALDGAIGFALSRAYERTLTGERGGLTNLALTKDADVLVLGSSRAQYHVMSSVLTARLGRSVYNAGLKGHDLLYASAVLDLWKRRHGAPHAVVLTTDMESLLDRPDEAAAAQLLAPYLDRSERVQEILVGGDWIGRLRYTSRSYRYNGKVLSIAKNLVAKPDPAYDGYLPAVGVFDPSVGTPRHGMNDVPGPGGASQATAVAQSERPYSALRLRMLEAIAGDVREGNGTLFLVHPPIWGLPERAHATWHRRLEQILPKLGRVELVDLCEHVAPEHFAGRPELFLNFNHLNEAGARIFSTLLAERMHRSLGVERAAQR